MKTKTFKDEFGDLIEVVDNSDTVSLEFTRPDGSRAFSPDTLNLIDLGLDEAEAFATRILQIVVKNRRTA